MVVKLATGTLDRMRGWSHESRDCFHLALLFLFIFCAFRARAQLTGADRQAVLDVHNRVREQAAPEPCQFELPALRWNDSLASVAAEQVGSCIFNSASFIVPSGQAGPPPLVLGMSSSWRTVDDDRGVEAVLRAWSSEGTLLPVRAEGVPVRRARRYVRSLPAHRLERHGELRLCAAGLSDGDRRAGQHPASALECDHLDLRVRACSRSRRVPVQAMRSRQSDHRRPPRSQHRRHRPDWTIPTHAHRPAHTSRASPNHYSDVNNYVIGDVRTGLDHGFNANCSTDWRYSNDHRRRWWTGPDSDTSRTNRRCPRGNTTCRKR